MRSALWASGIVDSTREDSEDTELLPCRSWRDTPSTLASMRSRTAFVSPSVRTLFRSLTSPRPTLLTTSEKDSLIWSIAPVAACSVIIGASEFFFWFVYIVSSVGSVPAM